MVIALFIVFLSHLTTGPRDAIPALPVNSLQPLAGMLRWIVVAVLTIAVALPLGFILFQSLLSAPFFDANKTLGIEGFRFIFSDPDFWSAVISGHTSRSARAT